MINQIQVFVVLYPNQKLKKNRIFLYKGIILYQGIFKNLKKIQCGYIN